MSRLKRLSEIIIFSNLWVALAASGLTLNTYLVINEPINKTLIYLVFLATFSVYNLQRLIKHYFRKKNISNRHLWIYSNFKTLSFLVGITSLASIYLFFNIFSIVEFLYLLPFSAVSVLYALSIFSNKRALRDLPFIKVFLIAITWAVSTVALPLIELKNPITFQLINLFVFNLLFIIAIAIPFDIRDLKLDNIKTIPQVFGINTSVNISLALILICFLIASFSFFTIGQVLPLALTFYIVNLSKKEMPELYYSGILDGSILLFPIFNLIF